MLFAVTNELLRMFTCVVIFLACRNHSYYIYIVISGLNRLFQMSTIDTKRDIEWFFSFYFLRIPNFRK